MADAASKPSRPLRTPPHNTDAERALLGAIMLRPDVLHDVSVTVYPDSFFAERHRLIYQGITEIFSQGNPVDMVTLTSRMKEAGTLDRCGGASYITELIETVPAAGNALYYAQLVQGKHSLRTLINAAEDIAELGYGDPENVDDTLDQAEKKVMLATQSPTAQKFKTIGSSLTEAWERFEYLSANQDQQRGIPSGFNSLDNLLAGFQRSDLIILACATLNG